MSARWPLGHSDASLVGIAWVVLGVKGSCWSVNGERLLKMWGGGNVVGGHGPLLLLLGCSLLGGLLLGVRSSRCLLLGGELLLLQILLLLRLLQSLRLRLRLRHVLLLRGEHLLLPLLLQDGLLLSNVHGHAGLGANDAHACVRRVLHGHARLARLAGLLHEVIVWMGHGWRRVCRTRKRRLGQGHGLCKRDVSELPREEDMGGCVSCCKLTLSARAF